MFQHVSSVSGVILYSTLRSTPISRAPVTSVVVHHVTPCFRSHLIQLNKKHTHIQSSCDIFGCSPCFTMFPLFSGVILYSTLGSTPISRAPVRSVVVHHVSPVSGAILYSTPRSTPISRAPVMSVVVHHVSPCFLCFQESSYTAL